MQLFLGGSMKVTLPQMFAKMSKAHTKPSTTACRALGRHVRIPAF